MNFNSGMQNYRNEKWLIAYLIWMVYFTDKSTKAPKDWSALPQIMWTLRKLEPETSLFMDTGLF